MRKRLEKFGEVELLDETNGFRQDFVEKMGKWMLEYHPRHDHFSRDGKSGICVELVVSELILCIGICETRFQ